MAALLDRLRRSSYVRQLLLTLATRAATFAIGVISGVIIARLLGPTGRGEIAVAGALGGLGTQFANLGLHSANTFYVSRDRRRLPALFGNSLLAAAALGLGAFVVLGALVLVKPSIAPLPRALLWMALLSIPLGLALQFGQGILLGLRRVRTYNQAELINRLVSFGVLAAAFVLTVRRSEVLFMAGVVATAIAMIWVLRGVRSCLEEPPSISYPLMRQMLHYGFKAYASCLFAFLVLRVDLLMVQYFVGLEQAGYYATAASLGNILYAVPAMAGMIAFPRLSAETSFERRWRRTHKLSLVTGLVMLPATGLAIWVAPPLVRFLYTEEFLPAVPAFQLLALAMVFYGINNILSNYLAAIEFPWFAVYIWLIAAVLNVALNWVWLPRHGIQGAAVASIISYGFVCIAQYAYCLRVAHRHASQA